MTIGHVFYQQSIRAVPPVNPDHWSFAVIGGVRHPLILSFADLIALPTQTLRCTIACAGHSPDRPLLGEALWRGVPLQTLLDSIDIAPDVRFARLHAADGYTTVLPLDRLASTLLAYEMDGVPLPPEHGFPARLIAPGLFGYKMPKWIERIELRTSSDGGFWETRGFSLEGDAGVKVALLDSAPSAGDALTLSGIASAGSSPLRSISISIDDGDAMPVPFTQDDPFMLAHWQIDWTPPGAGDYHIRVIARSPALSAEHELVIKVG